MKKLIVAIALFFGLSAPALAQCNGKFSAGSLCGSISGGAPGQIPAASVPGILVLPNADIYVGNASNKAAAVAPTGSGDCTFTFSNLGVYGFTCLKTNGVSFGSLATQSSVTGAQLPSPFTSGTATGNTSIFVTAAAGARTTNHVATWDVNGNIQDGGASAGTVTSVTCGTGLSGGTFTTTGTCAISLSTVSNFLGTNISLSNTGTYFDGPSMAQGTSGTWVASGGVVIQDSSANGLVNCKLWDGTTVMASGRQALSSTVSIPYTMHLSGILTSPAANIKISCQDTTATTGQILFNASGNSKDGYIYGFRIN